MNKNNHIEKRPPFWVKINPELFCARKKVFKIKYLKTSWLGTRSALLGGVMNVEKVFPEKKQAEINASSSRCARVYEQAARFLQQSIPFSLSPQSHQRGIGLLTEYLASMFAVSQDEVAFIVLDPQGQDMFFIAPQYLAELTSKIPFNPRDSLAGRALCDKRVLIENRSIGVNHLAYFERVRPAHGPARRIEKLLTYPIIVGKSPVGVVQISRKERASRIPRENFKKEDFGIIEQVRRPILNIMQGVRSLKRDEGTPEFKGLKLRA